MKSQLTVVRVMKVAQRLAVIGVGAALCSSVVAIQSVQASPVTYDFNVNNVNGPTVKNANGSGFITYDPSLLNDPFNNFRITDFGLSFLGQTYGIGSLRFLDRGTPVSFVNVNGDQLLGANLDIPLYTPDCPSFPPDNCQAGIVIRDNTFSYNPPPTFGTTNLATGTVAYSLPSPSTSVPEPSPVLGTLAFGVLLGTSLLLNQKRESSKTLNIKSAR